MPDPFDPRQLIIAKAQAADRAAEDVAQQREQRQTARRHRSKAREVHARWTGNREQQREARARAESWLQALRAWEVRGGNELVSSKGGGSGGGFTFLVGQYTRSGNGDAYMEFRKLHTPLGWVSEARVVALCAADPLLSRIRDGGGVASLVHAGGQGWAGPEARAYAFSLLTLAHNLGDVKATELLPLVQT